MRYCLVILILICLSAVATPARAELVRGRVLNVDSDCGWLQLEVDNLAGGERRQLMLKLDSLPADLQLGSQIDVEMITDEGVMRVKRISKGSWGHGKDMTGVRSRLKKAQRGSSGGQGSGGGGRH